MVKKRAICGVGSHSQAERGLDFYSTPRVATEALLIAEKQWLPSGLIGEPACGDGAIVNVLRQAGRQVVASDIVARGCPKSTVRNFLIAPVRPVAAIITNPPFRRAREFIERAFECAPYVAMLLRLAFLEGASRKPWFESMAQLPLARVHVSSRRLPMMHRDGWTGPKAGSAVCHAWFVWDANAYRRPPEINWFDYKLPKAANDNVRVVDPNQIDLEDVIRKAS